MEALISAANAEVTNGFLYTWEKEGRQMGSRRVALKRGFPSRTLHTKKSRQRLSGPAQEPGSG